jgi:hypothetical protein
MMARHRPRRHAGVKGACSGCARTAVEGLDEARLVLGQVPASASSCWRGSSGRRALQLEAGDELAQLARQLERAELVDLAAQGLVHSGRALDGRHHQRAHEARCDRVHDARRARAQ